MKRTISTRTLVNTLILLIVLTVISIGISFIPMHSKWHLTAGLLFGTTKAIFVVLFFMQVAASPRLTWCVVVFAIGFLLILFSLTFADYITRSMLPYVPGH